jgi:hypothetical protein
MMIFLFLFNVIGYYGIYMAMTRQANIAIDRQIDNDEYEADQTVTIKIALTLPYPVQQNNFERIQGDFEHQGEFYKLVKQKYLNDTVYIVCIKNNGEKKAFKVFSDFVKLSTDQSSSSTSQHAKVLANLIKDYSPVISEVNFSPRESIELASIASFYNNLILGQDYQEFSPPPEAGC